MAINWLLYAEFMSDFIPLIILLKLNDVTFKARMGENKGKFLIDMNNTKKKIRDFKIGVVYEIFCNCTCI